VSNDPKSPFAETERVLAVWRQYQRTNVHLAGGDPDLVDRELDELAAEVLRGLWHGRARTWGRLGTPGGQDVSKIDVLAQIDLMIAGFLSPECGRGNACGRFTHTDEDRVVWSMDVHTRDGQATIYVLEEGDSEDDSYLIPSGAVVVSDDGIASASRDESFDVPESVVEALWSAWHASRVGRN
jgi:hypothetical protein